MKFEFTCFIFVPQCRVVKITILGEEGVPVQVDGEAWVQPPGLVKILHKNRSQMLVRDKVCMSVCMYVCPCVCWETVGVLRSVYVCVSLLQIGDQDPIS